ncbi:MAG: sensor histidine kinase [Candidatus Eremiobacteraeota bacterium]|nr:sensor histidine kinase [Candidatus Eremiobacteraeota bacterium]
MAELRRLPIMQEGFMPFLWLIYAVPVPLSLIGSNAPAWLIALQLGALLVFLAGYVVGYGSSGWRAMAFVLLFFALGVITSPTDPYAMTYFIYAASMLAWGLPARDAYRALALYVPLVGVVCWLLHVSVYGAVPAVVFSAVVGFACVSNAEQKRSHARLRQANEEIERLAQIAERERIARDLHDVLGHTLSLIVLKSQLASKLAERDPVRASAEIREVEQIARTSLDELREAVAGYRGAGIDEELAHARDVLGSAGLRFECEAEAVRLAPAHESVLALAIREAVTNVVRHARASAVRMRLVSSGDACRFEIHDDGVGGSANEGMGLSGMRERVESHGGSLQRTTDGGTHLVVTLPLEAGAAR